MARQKGIFKVSGKMDDVVFYHTKDGALARMVGSLNKDRVMKDPAFERSRKAGAAFARATKGSGLVRRAMGPKAMALGETRMTGKLSGRLLKVMNTNATKLKDQQRIYKGDMGLLKGFQWNSERPLDTVLKVVPAVTIDRAAGLVRIEIPSFVNTRELAYPDGVTHYELFGSAAAVDFEALKYDAATASDGLRPINGKGTGVVRMEFNLKAGSKLPIIVGMGVLFYAEGLVFKGGECFGIVGIG